MNHNKRGDEWLALFTERGFRNLIKILFLHEHFAIITDNVGVFVYNILVVTFRAESSIFSIFLSKYGKLTFRT